MTIIAYVNSLHDRKKYSRYTFRSLTLKRILQTF